MPQGVKVLSRQLPEILEDAENTLPMLARHLLAELKAEHDQLLERVDRCEQQLKAWHANSTVSQRLASIPGIGVLTATALAATVSEGQDFRNGRQLAAYLGLVPSEHSSGARRRQGAITRTGNGHARRMLVESAWSYRFPARQTAHLKRKAANASDEAKVIAWRAQKRLCGRYRTLLQAGKNTKQTTVAIARELTGFIWDIVCHEMPKIQPQVAR